jgi:hypothetical protein
MYFSILETLLGRGSAHRRASTYTGQRDTENAYIHALSGIGTHDPSVRMVQDKTHGHWDRQSWIIIK